jgi:hypothetical protein
MMPAAGNNAQEGGRVRTIDEMLVRRLLTPAQHHEIRAWISQARTPEAIMEMPAPLWRSLALASVLMGIDADLTQPPCFDAAAGGVRCPWRIR